MRSVLVGGALLMLSAAGASAQYYGPGYGPPPPPHYGPPPPPGYGPPPRYYGGGPGYGPPPPPRRCWFRQGPYGPERVCRGW